jgi:glycosyltransferase involved in cell wall biosynthesis
MSQGIKGHFWEQCMLPIKSKGKLLWSPSNSGPISVRRQVVTIHDVAMIDHPEWFNEKFCAWYGYMLPLLCKRAEHIITISDFTKQRLLELFDLPEQKITKIYNGASLNPTGTSKPNVPFNRYIMSLGSIEPRKNISLLLNCWKSILLDIPEDVGLVIVGAHGYSRIFKNKDLADVSERVHFTGYLSDTDVMQLYQNALLFVYLSAYEGFGLPPLEAMALGTPVIAGNNSALPEVVGDAGILVDTQSPFECESAIKQLINNSQLRTHLSLEGMEQAKKFDWTITAEQTFKVLQQFE